MKKTLILSAIVTFCLTISALAAPLYADLKCVEDGETIGWIHFRQDGSFTMTLNGDNYSGTYTVDGKVAPGGTYETTLNIRGVGQERGTFAWGIQDKLTFILGDYLFVLARR